MLRKSITEKIVDAEKLKELWKDLQGQELTTAESLTESRCWGIGLNTQNLINSVIKSMMELFEMHDQVFILKDSDVYKLYYKRERPQDVLELRFLNTQKTPTHTYYKLRSASKYRSSDESSYSMLFSRACLNLVCEVVN